jgi:hypothetical protein
MEQLGFHWTDFHQISYWRIFRRSFEKKFKFQQILTRIRGTLHKDKHTFLIIPRAVVLRMKNVSDKHRTENQNIHIVINLFLFLENRAVYEICGKIL